MDAEKGKQLFEIKKNQLKLVERRGYNIDRERPIFTYDYEQFLDIYVPFAKKQKKSLRNVLSTVYKNKKDEKLVVHYADISTSKQLGVEVINEFIHNMDKNKSKNGIIITPIPLSSTSKKKISELLTYNIYIFTESEMSYDPTEHFLVPKHRALSVNEQRELLQKNNISIDQLPVILTSDIIARYYGFQTGQIIEITRTNLYDTIVQESLAYRQVKEEI